MRGIDPHRDGRSLWGSSPRL